MTTSMIFNENENYEKSGIETVKEKMNVATVVALSCVVILALIVVGLVVVLISYRRHHSDR